MTFFYRHFNRLFYLWLFLSLMSLAYALYEAPTPKEIEDVQMAEDKTR